MKPTIRTTTNDLVRALRVAFLDIRDRSASKSLAENQSDNSPKITQESDAS